MTMTWKEKRQRLESLGITDELLLETARRATARERVQAREAEIRVRLGIVDPLDRCVEGGLIAALDLLGKAGPYGAGHSHEGIGSTDRPAGLDGLPGHQALAGGAWDAAIASMAWTEIHADFNPDDPGWAQLAPWSLEDGGSSLELRRPHGLEPQWWAPLTPWLEAVARRVVLAHVTDDVRWRFGVLVEGARPAVRLEPADAEALMSLCRAEHARAAVATARARSGRAMSRPQSDMITAAEAAVRQAREACRAVPHNGTPSAELGEAERALEWARARLEQEVER